MTLESVPVFSRGVKFRFDSVRSTWVVLTPERAFLPDETAQAILSAVDGTLTVREIAHELGARFGGPIALIEADVLEMLIDLASRYVVQDQGTASAGALA